MFGKPFDEITMADIADLKDNKVAESKTLDYKRDFYDFKGDGPKEFLKDVTAMANTNGGFIIVGMAEGEPSIPSEIVGLTNFDEGKSNEWMQNLIRDNVVPRLTNWKPRLISDDQLSVLVIRIGRSFVQPHMINRSSGQDFYRRFVIRNNVGNEPMDYQQLKDAFLLSGEIEKRVLEFHNERLHLIDTGQSHPSIPDVARYIVHLIPVSAIESATYVDLTRIEERCPNFRFDDPFVDYTRWTVEGYLGWRNYRSDTNKAMTYKLVRNDGVVEIVNTAGFLHEEEKFSPLMARQCIEKIVRTHLKYLAALDVSYPMIVRTALRHVQGWKGWTQDCLHTIKNAIDRPNIHLPEFIIMDSDEDITSYMDRIELTLWNAFGESHERMKKMPHSR